MSRSIVAAALAVAVSATPATSAVTCFLEGSAGKNVTTSRVSDIDGPLVVSADGLQGGVGAGCDYAIGNVVEVGLLARYDLPDIKTRLGTANLDGDAVWSVAARAGIRINPGTLVYGLAGIAGTELTYPGINTGPQGILLGAGLEVDIAVKNLSLFAEYDRIQWDTSKVDGTSIKPDSDVFRVGLRLKLDFMK